VWKCIKAPLVARRWRIGAVVLVVLVLMMAFRSPLAAQLQLRWSDGSIYLTGDAQMQAYYLYVPGGGNSDGSCQNYGTYITVANKTPKTLSFYANVQVAGGGHCGGSQTIPIQGNVGPNSAIKVRAMPDLWVPPNTTPGAPGIQFTNVAYR
jgi:hypothetical protein